jgi:tetratricopeptide (TPR) repeat protein
MKHKYVKSVVILLLVGTLLGGCSGKSANDYYKEGIKYFKSSEYEKASENLAKALEMNSERAEYFVDYGMSLIMLGKYDLAIQNFDRAILDKDNAIVKRNNKTALRGKGIAFFKSHNYTEAINQFDKALEINELSDLNMDILYYKGNAEQNAGLYKEALETYNSILDKKNSDATVYSCRALVYSKLGEYDKSLADYDKAIDLDKDNYDYYFGKYALMIEKNDIEGAALVLELASNIKVETQEDKFNLAKIHFFMGEYDTAIAELSDAFRNGFSESYYYLGQIYEKEEDYESAVNNYSLFIEDETQVKPAIVYNKIAICLIKLKKYEDALSYIQAGIQLNDINTNQALLSNEIVVYENIGKFEKAYSLMKDYLKVYPDDEEAIKENEFLKTRLAEVSTKKDK